MNQPVQIDWKKLRSLLRLLKKCRNRFIRGSEYLWKLQFPNSINILIQEDDEPNHSIMPYAKIRIFFGKQIIDFTTCTCSECRREFIYTEDAVCRELLLDIATWLKKNQKTRTLNAGQQVFSPDQIIKKTGHLLKAAF